MRLSDVIAVNSFPAVIAGSDIAAYRRDPTSPQATDFLSGYLGFDARSQHALHTTLACLARRDVGGAFWFNGVFGSGKSHLLGLLTLLSEGSGHEVFARSHPDCADYLTHFTPRLCLHISLDEFDSTKLGLEQIFLRELAAEWKRRGYEPLEIDQSGSRIEAFATLEMALEEKTLQGLVICFDELSLFLGSRSHHDLQGDAAFLQFLGSHTRRAPLWVFAALQKTVDDISGLESYSLSQIRDRFTLLPLSLANLPALVKKRLVQVKNEGEVETTCRATWTGLEERLPRLDFGPEEWRDAFPFHPTTLALLEGVTGRFFSRTRSAAVFCAHAIELNNPVETRIGADAIWNYFEPELESHPDLRPLQNVWHTWLESLNDIFPEKDQTAGLRLIKYVLLAKIAGQSPTPIQVANALDVELELDGDVAYQYAAFLLERLRSKGSYLAVERGDERLQDRYTIDLGRRVGEMARRQVSAALESIAVGDLRLAPYVLGACKSEPLPLHEYLTPRSVTVFWQSASRRLSVEVWDGRAAQQVANRVIETRQFGSAEDAVLIILPPFAMAPNTEAVTHLLDEDALAACWFWRPRQPARDEWDLAREALAVSISLADPGLADNRRGRALLEHLKKEAPARDAQLTRTALRLLLEGEITLGNGAFLEASELARADNFSGLLEVIGDFAWPQLFPNFVKMAPRARLLTPSNADTLCLEILRRPASEPYFAPSLERLARHIGESLGVAKSSAGRWKISAGSSVLTEEFVGIAAERIPYSALEAHFAKSKWGLRPEQTAILTCALLRSGRLAAFDGQGVELEAAKMGLPLRRSIHTVCEGRLLDSPTWTQIAVLVRELCSVTLASSSFEEAHKASDALQEWRETTEQQVSLALARAIQLKRSLGHDIGSWPSFDAACVTLGAVFEAIPTRGAAFDVLSSVAPIDLPKLRTALPVFKRFESGLAENTSRLLTAQALLANPELVTSAELSEQRTSLSEALTVGESVVLDRELEQSCAHFVQQYHADYRDWHSTQNDAARWNSWRRLLQSNELRVFDGLSTLTNRAFGTGTRAEIENELAKRCPRDGTLASGEVVCSSCGLRLGQRLQVRDKASVETLLTQELTSLQSALREEKVQGYLLRAASPILEWKGRAELLLPLISNANLNILNDAFAPRRVVARSFKKLEGSLTGCRTSEEMQLAFKKWLDAGDGLAGDDEVDLKP